MISPDRTLIFRRTRPIDSVCKSLPILSANAFKCVAPGPLPLTLEFLILTIIHRFRNGAGSLKIGYSRRALRPYESWNAYRVTFSPRRSASRLQHRCSIPKTHPSIQSGTRLRFWPPSCGVVQLSNTIQLTKCFSTLLFNREEFSGARTRQVRETVLAPSSM